MTKIIIISVLLTALVALPSSKKESSEMPGMCLYVMPIGGMCMAPTIPGTNYCIQHAPNTPETCFCNYQWVENGVIKICGRICIVGGNGKCANHYAAPLQ